MTAGFLGQAQSGSKQGKGSSKKGANTGRVKGGADAEPKVSGDKQQKRLAPEGTVKKGARKVKDALVEASGLPNLKKGSWWNKLTAVFTFLFFEEKGREKLRDIIDGDTFKEMQVGFLGLSAKDEEAYFEIKEAIEKENPGIRSAFGRFARKCIESEYDFDRFRWFMAKFHISWKNTENKARIKRDEELVDVKESPVVHFLKEVMLRDGDFEKQVEYIGLSVLKTELGALLGYKDFFKNPLVIVPILLTLFFLYWLIAPVFRDFFAILD